MDLKVVSVTVCLLALAICTVEASIPKCCVKTKAYIPPKTLRKVVRWEVQQNNGACEISALILHVRDSIMPICAHPKLMGALRKVIRRRKRHNRQRTHI